MNFTTAKFDRRRKYYMVLDCETATMPCAGKYEGNIRKNISIAKPLIYDIGWQIIDRNGKVYERMNFLISEIFSVPSIFNTAYYASKRPIYIDKLAANEIEIVTWKTAIEYFEKALSICDSIGAYNSMFDFKKAIPFTDLYISKLYSADFYEWETYQNKIIDSIANGTKKSSEKEFEPDVFRFHGNIYPLFDLWGLSCKHILDSDEYRAVCDEKRWYTESGKFYKTSAETTYRFITGQEDFDEAHTAIDDAEIESEIFKKIVHKTIKNLEIGIIYFPFRIVGQVPLEFREF